MFPAELDERIRQAIRENPWTEQLFIDICDFYSPKKRIIYSGDANESIVSALLTVTSPIRKKAKLLLGRLFMFLTVDDQVVFELELSNIHAVWYFPTPNKTKENYTLCVIPKTNSAKIDNPVVFSIDSSVKIAYLKDYKCTKPNHALLFMFQEFVPNAIFYTPQTLFESEYQKQKNKRMYNIDCYNGSKDGHLFVSKQGILFGLKKPFYHFDKSSIRDAQVLSITGRTFNIQIETETEKVEFSMIDASEYARLSKWIPNKNQLEQISNAAQPEMEEDDEQDYEENDSDGDTDSDENDAEESEDLGSALEDNEDAEQDKESEDLESAQEDLESAQEDLESAQQDNGQALSPFKRQKLDPMELQIAAISYSMEKDETDELEF